ncbi:hypothetical protein ABMY20_15175 [Tenacibaculum sp. SSH1-16]|uniref:hypothetical protein n=1 Tax=Tenacibaculum sp. SSH1-16 TaxID=3136667 RepID=UPI0032C416E2|nr:hypothetical protein BACY1_20600 [Tenacibaculum mesophilum]
MSNALTAVIEKTNTGFSGYILKVDGIIATEATIAELKEALQEALKHEIDYLEEMGKDASHLKNATINYSVDLEQFFTHYNVINKSAFAEYIGLNKSLFRQYVKGLAPLSSEKMLQITNGLHRLAADIEDIVLV